MPRILPAAFACCLLAFPAMAQSKLVVFFPDWSGALDDSARSVISQAADLAKKTPDATITVTGYADDTGSEKANLYLTQLRAQRVIDWLVSDGVPASQLTLEAAGKQAEKGVASRRVEIAFSK